MASSIPIVAQERHDFDKNNEVCNHYYMIGGDETNCYLKLVINSEDMHLQLFRHLSGLPHKAAHAIADYAGQHAGGHNIPMIFEHASALALVCTMSLTKVHTSYISQNTIVGALCPETSAMETQGRGSVHQHVLIYFTKYHSWCFVP